MPTSRRCRHRHVLHDTEVLLDTQEVLYSVKTRNSPKSHHTLELEKKAVRYGCAFLDGPQCKNLSVLNDSKLSCGSSLLVVTKDCKNEEFR